MRVALVARSVHPVRGGVELHVYNIARGLAERGHDVMVFVEHIRPLEAEGNTVPVHWNTGLLTLRRQLRDFRPDVVHLHGARSPYISTALLAARQAGFRTILTPHCFYPAQDLAGRVKRAIFDRTLGLASLRCAHKLVCLTENDRKDAISLGAPAELVRIIPNSIRLPDALPSERVLAWKRTRGLGRFLLSVGRLDRVKGGEFLIRTMPGLPTDLALVFIGPDAGCRSDWEQLAASLGLGTQVRFLGEVSQEELLAAYQACTALVLASRYEGLPTVLLEAMALGAICIATDSGGTPHLLRHGQNGFLCRPGDGEALCSLVGTVLNSELKSIRCKAKDDVRRDYSWDVNLKRLVELYLPEAKN